MSQTRSDAEDLDGAAEVEPRDAVGRTAAAEKADRKSGKKAQNKADRPAARKRTSPALFYRQIIAELRKVVWPTRSELFTYTTVVIVFVLGVIGIVALLDFGLTRAVQGVFG